MTFSPSPNMDLNSSSLQDKSFLVEASNTSVCGWKGLCNYYDIHAGGKVNAGACWEYREPKEAAKNIKGHVAFWKGVQVK